MKSWKLLMLCSAVSLTACQGSSEPPQWSAIQGKPDGFKDDTDDVRGDADIRAIAHDEATQVVGASGYLKSESDPAFAASAASAIASTDVANWNTAFAWGDHASAGYLKSESDPAFAASAASTVSTTDVTNWDTAFGWGNHASAGYLKSESDPKVGALSSGSVPVWNGTALRDGALHEVNGNVGVGTSTPSTLLTVSTLAKFGASFTSSTSKSCSMSGFNWTNTPPSATACTTYCTTRGFASGAVTPTGSKNCGGASCDYISDFETCSTASMQNNGNCNSCASAFVCTCLSTGTELNGAVRVMNGNVGIGVAAPNSPLQVSGYLQLGTTAGAPPAADCDAAAERGRMLVDPATGGLWVCVNSGWVSK